MDSFDDILDVVKELVLTSAIIKMDTPEFHKYKLYFQGIYMALFTIRLFYLLLYKKEATLEQDIKFLIISIVINMLLFIVGLKSSLRDIDESYKKQCSCDLIVEYNDDIKELNKIKNGILKNNSNVILEETNLEEDDY